MKNYEKYAQYLQLVLKICSAYFCLNLILINFCLNIDSGSVLFLCSICQNIKIKSLFIDNLTAYIGVWDVYSSMFNKSIDTWSISVCTCTCETTKQTSKAINSHKIFCNIWNIYRTNSYIYIEKSITSETIIYMLIWYEYMMRVHILVMYIDPLVVLIVRRLVFYNCNVNNISIFMLEMYGRTEDTAEKFNNEVVQLWQEF